MTNLQCEIQGVVDKYVNNFINQLVDRNGIDRAMLESTWRRIISSAEQQPEQQPESRIKPIDMELVGSAVTPGSVTPPTRNMIMNATVAELKALCKVHKLSVGGKKQDLMDRLAEEYRSGGATGATGATDESMVPSAPKKKKRSPNRMPQIPISSIQIKKNSYGNYEHPETRLIFDKDSRQVIGKQQEDGTINPLGEQDIQQCDQFKFTYLVPEKILNEADKQLSSKIADEIVETLEDIIGSDEEFEEFYEETED